MDYISLGRTGMQVSRLCLGAMMFGQRTDEASSAEIIEYALAPRRWLGCRVNTSPNTRWRCDFA